MRIFLYTPSHAGWMLEEVPFCYAREGVVANRCLWASRFPTLHQVERLRILHQTKPSPSVSELINDKLHYPVIDRYDLNTTFDPHARFKPCSLPEADCGKGSHQASASGPTNDLSVVGREGKRGRNPCQISRSCSD